jgi:hypothetical protein
MIDGERQRSVRGNQDGLSGSRRTPSAADPDISWGLGAEGVPPVSRVFAADRSSLTGLKRLV